MLKTDERMRPFALRIPEKLFLDIQHLAHQEKRFINAQILYKQHLENLRRKDTLRGAKTTEISVRLGSYSASHFEGSAITRQARGFPYKRTKEDDTLHP